MRLILEILGRVVGFEANVLHVKMTSSENQPEQDEFEHAPMDPHGTLSSQVERRSDLEDMYGQERKFGFGVHVPPINWTPTGDPLIPVRRRRGSEE
jgi:hypothetical protein